MADLVTNLYDFNDDSMQRLMKDLNYMFTHLDERNVKRLYTEYCNIQSEDGETVISGPLLTMLDGAGTKRLEMGWDSVSGEFKFSIYDSTGGAAVELDSTGDAVFRGKINTAKDIYIGERAFIGWGGNTNLPEHASTKRGIYFLNPGSTQYVGSLYTTMWRYQSVGDTSPSLHLQSSGNLTLLSQRYMQLGVGDSASTTPSRIFITNTKYVITMLEWDASDDARISTDYGIYMGEKGIIPMYHGATHTVDKEIICTEDLEYDYVDSECRQFYVRNTKTIALPSTAWSIGVSADCDLSLSTNRLIGRGAKLKVKNSSANVMEIYLAISAVNLTESYDGTTFSTGIDKIVLIAYIDDPTAVQSVGPYAYLGQSSAACNIYYFNNQTFTTGWNILINDISPSSVIGAPDMTAVTWIKLGWKAVENSSGHYIIFDHLGLHRGSTMVYTSQYHDFMDYYSTGYKIYQNTYCFPFYDYPFSDNNCISLNGTTKNERMLTIGYNVPYFRSELEYTNLRSNCSPCIHYTINDNSTSRGFVETYVTSGYLILRGADIYGTTFGRKLAVDYGFSPEYQCIIGLKKSNYYDYTASYGSYAAYFYLNNFPNTYREIHSFFGPELEDVGYIPDIYYSEHKGTLHIGAAESGIGALITRATVKKSRKPINWRYTAKA